MATRILVPSALRQFTEGRDAVALEGRTVGEILAALVARYPDLRRHLYTDEGRLRSFVNVYVNEEDVRYMRRDGTELAEGDVVSIVPSIAGGAPGADAPAGLGLSAAELLRYSRHLIMPEVALAGQHRLKAASVLLVGTGGLGAPLGLYLAAAGVGRIGLVDFDVVDYTNLQRQVTFGTRDVGRPKLEAAYERLHDLNPEVDIVRHDVRLTSDNAMEIIAGYDIVADGTDNFPTRYLVNDACVLQGKPNVYASIFRFEGQATVFALNDGPCYRCLYPEPPPPGLVPSCAEGGVLGVLPGIVGAIQANETIKLILGKGASLSGRLLLFDALGMSFRELKLRRDPDCPLCGERRTIHRLIDYAEFCGVRVEEGESSPTVPAITVTELKRWLDAGDEVFVLDVREPHERDICHIGGALIPMRQIPARASELDSARDIVVYCRTGARSGQVVEFLRRAGFSRVWNLRGGIHAWSDEVDPTVAKY
ncbi:MAG: molybdopterin-synthase adenylyltransferase MoeB [Candidatus Krumholzibacteria bacterium]|nr:molybdopterin-synthase adenylyltransferase MoeB [Candidatus Krumholzibacteria bacterium]